MASVPYTPTSDPTDGERAQLYRYHLANKFLNQHELAQGYEACKYLTLLDINAKLIFIRFERSFDRSISQSTVSRILRNSKIQICSTCRNYEEVNKAQAAITP